MPELPEVETIRRGIEPHVVGRTIDKVVVRDRRLRWPIARGFEGKLAGKRIRAVGRRGKYLLLDLDDGRVVLHLGMTGNLALLEPGRALRKHDHFDLELSGNLLLRFNDPRRFGAALWWPATQPQHALIRHMGPEPLTGAFNADYLVRLARRRSAPVKNFLMDGRIVVGVGNIYAVEALYRAGIRPDWWKLPPQGEAAAWGAIGAVIERFDPLCRGVLVLGMEAAAERLRESFAAAARCPWVRGFAVGRSIFAPAAEGWFAGRLTDVQAIDDVAARYQEVIGIWVHRGETTQETA